MKHLLNNLSQEEKDNIRRQHSGGMNVVTENFDRLLNNKLGDVKPLINEDEEVFEQLGSGVRSKLAGLGARVQTTTQNLKTAITPTTSGQRITDSPKLNAALARVKSRVQSFNKIISDLNADLEEIKTTATPFNVQNGPFQAEASQLIQTTTNYQTILKQVIDYNDYMSKFEFKKPQLTPTNTTPTAATTPTTTAATTPTTK